MMDRGRIRLPCNMLILRFNMLILSFNMTDRGRVRLPCNILRLRFNSADKESVRLRFNRVRLILTKRLRVNIQWWFDTKTILL